MRLINIVIFIAFLQYITFSYYAFAKSGGANKYSCSLFVNSVNFGDFYPYDYTPTKLNSSISVQCIAFQENQNVDYVITFSAGNSSNSSTRSMQNSKRKTLIYNIYSNNSVTQILGNGSGKTSIFSMSYLLSPKDGMRNDNFIIYSVIPIQPFLESGDYSDVITVTLIY